MQYAHLFFACISVAAACYCNYTYRRLTALGDNQWELIKRLRRLKPTICTKKWGGGYVAQIYLVDTVIWESETLDTRLMAISAAESKIKKEGWE